MNAVDSNLGGNAWDRVADFQPLLWLSRRNINDNNL